MPKATKEKPSGEEPLKPAEKPVSLRPLDLKAAVRGLFKVKPKKLPRGTSEDCKPNG